MNSREVLRRLEAFDAGEPLPAGTTRHLVIADDEDLLALAFVRMGGESLPWAAGVQLKGSTPQVHAIPDARDRDRVGAMLAAITPVIAAHLQSAQEGGGQVTADSDPDDVPLRQVWVPNGSHVQMLHMLNLRYTFAQAGDPGRAAALRALGRLAGFLFREAARPGEATIIDASAALQEAFTFPIDELRQQHLGLLLALLETPGDRAGRMAAGEAAEALSVSISLDPALERDVLEPLVTRYNEAERAGGARRARKAEKEIQAVLTVETERRLGLTLHAAEILRSDGRPLNQGAVDLARDSTKARQRDYLWLEEQLSANGEGNGFFPPSPETDRDRRTGAARYLRLAGASEEVEGKLVHDDIEVQDDAIAAGDALRGRITRVEDRAPSGSRATEPVWTIETSSAGPTRVRRGSRLCVAGVPKRAGVVIDVVQEGEVRRIELHITGWKRRPNAAKHPQHEHLPSAVDAVLEGTEVVLVPAGLGAIGMSKARRVRHDTGPGAWLTHGTGSPPRPAGRRGTRDVLKEVERLRV